jgi:formylglycine-generating enzyme required for sulfatase activity
MKIVIPIDRENYIFNEERVLRGGGWRIVASYARVSRRVRIIPSDRDDDLGFRIVRKT